MTMSVRRRESEYLQEVDEKFSSVVMMTSPEELKNAYASPALERGAPTIRVPLGSPIPDLIQSQSSSSLVDRDSSLFYLDKLPPNTGHLGPAMMDNNRSTDNGRRKLYKKNSFKSKKKGRRASDTAAGLNPVSGNSMDWIHGNAGYQYHLPVSTSSMDSYQAPMNVAPVETDKSSGGCNQVPMSATTAAIGCCAVAGGILLGPVGLIIGAAALGLAAGYNQIPEEKRVRMQNKARKKLDKVAEKVRDGPCCSRVDKQDFCDVDTVEPATEMKKMIDPSMANCESDVDCAKMHSDLVRKGMVEAKSEAPPVWLGNMRNQMNGEINLSTQENARQDTRSGTGSKGARSALPNEQIYQLPPTAQPIAWVDVVMSPYSSKKDKMEAMEEVLLYAKDKDYGRMYLEEGLLDSLLLVLTEFFQKFSNLLEFQRQLRVLQQQQAVLNELALDRRDQLQREVQLQHPIALLSARCCVALGKAHCAVSHTDGDLLLMSSYHRGMVPESRQLAQLLYEVPHHARATNPATVDEPLDYSRSDFMRVTLTLQQAEDLARLIMALASGRMKPDDTV